MTDSLLERMRRLALLEPTDETRREADEALLEWLHYSLRVEPGSALIRAWQRAKGYA